MTNDGITAWSTSLLTLITLPSVIFLLWDRWLSKRLCITITTEQINIGPIKAPIALAITVHVNNLTNVPILLESLFVDRPKIEGTVTTEWLRSGRTVTQNYLPGGFVGMLTKISAGEERIVTVTIQPNNGNWRCRLIHGRLLYRIDRLLPEEKIKQFVRWV